MYKINTGVIIQMIYTQIISFFISTSGLIDRSLNHEFTFLIWTVSEYDISGNMTEYSRQETQLQLYDLLTTDISFCRPIYIFFKLYNDSLWSSLHRVHYIKIYLKKNGIICDRE